MIIISQPTSNGMDLFKNRNQKMTPKKKGGLNWKFKGSFISQLINAILIIVILSTAYSLFFGNNTVSEDVPLSVLAKDVSLGLVRQIDVEGENLKIYYNSTSTATSTQEVIKNSMKEENTALTQSLVNYGVQPKDLESVKINVVSDKGFWYWVGNLLPFLLPLAFIGFIFWFLTRQVKGAGAQAFTFGQSKARISLPNDKTQKVTFADVAGAKEAKEELAEVVDFLKNPKKFLDIGAKIPKGLLLMGAPGTGKCVVGSTLLNTNKGIMRIDEVPKYFGVEEDNTVNGLNVVSLDKNTKFQSVSASHWYDLGEQKTKIITTDSGIDIEGTFEHPVVVVDEATGNFVFKRLDKITKEDWVVCGANAQVFGKYTKLPHPDMAYLLGVLTGDGCLTVKNRICLTSADFEILDRVQTIVKKYFNTKFNKTSSRPYDYEIRDTEVKSKLIEFGLSETYANCKKVSEWVRLAPKEFVVAFLQGLFDTDGTAEKRGSVSYSSSSKLLVDDVFVMLLNLGIVARKYDRKKLYNGKKQFYIQIYGDFVENFQREIGFRVERKRINLEKVCQKQRNTNVNLVPHQEERIKNIWLLAKDSTDLYLDREFYSQNLYKNIKRYMSGERYPSQGGMEVMIKGIQTISPRVSFSPEVSYLKEISSGKFFFTKVKGIKEGFEKVYDLTVPHLHNFLANGIINHNTLLARAVAGEANVAFFSISGSEFVEMFVGVGASRVRDLFSMAKAAAPSIIFVDEIDAVGRVRGTGVGGGNDEREQTLNQILVEMDGFEPNEKVIVMAATNRPDVLDPALLRPGRFDRRVVIELPDRDDREAILIVHSKTKPFAEDVNLRVVAERTPGFSGADLYSLMNEAAILAARENRKKVSQFDLIRSIEKVMLGPERKSHILSMKEKEITAYHEAGHALVASVLPYADPVHKISIISRGRAAGYTLKLPLEDRKLQSKKEFLDDIAVSLGGYVSEKMIFDDLTTGSSNDLQVSSALARDMVTRYGMSDKMGAQAFEGDMGRTMFGRGISDKEYSDKVSSMIDAEVTEIMDNAKAKAEQILKDHKKALEAIAKTLIEVETIEREAFEKILVANGIVPKKKKDIEHQA